MKERYYAFILTFITLLTFNIPMTMSNQIWSLSSEVFALDGGMGFTWRKELHVMLVPHQSIYPAAGTLVYY